MNKGPILKVLVIDDEPIVVEVAKAILEDMGHEVATRSSALGASAWIVREKPDVVLLDLSMPSLSGEAWLRIATRFDRRGEGERSPLFILFSGADQARLEELVKESMAVGYITKNAGLRGFETAFRRIVEESLR